MDRVRVRHTNGLLVEPSRPVDSRPPSRRANECRNASTQASQTLFTGRDQGRPSSDLAPPNPRSSRIQAIASTANRSHSGAIEGATRPPNPGRRAGPGPSPRRRSPIRSISRRATKKSADGSRSWPTRRRVHRSAATSSGSLLNSEYEHWNEVHRPVGSARPAYQFQSTVPRGISRSTVVGTKVRVICAIRAATRETSGPARTQGGTSRAEPGTRASPPISGSTRNPTSPRTWPIDDHPNRGSTRRPPVILRVIGERMGIAPSLSLEVRTTRARPSFTRTLVAIASRANASRFAVKKLSIQSGRSGPPTSS